MQHQKIEDSAFCVFHCNSKPKTREKHEAQRVASDESPAHLGHHEVESVLTIDIIMSSIIITCISRSPSGSFLRSP